MQYLIAELLQEYDNFIFVIERISLTQFHIWFQIIYSIQCFVLWVCQICFKKDWLWNPNA